MWARRQNQYPKSNPIITIISELDPAEQPTMPTVIVFACKSNSCRSQMAEGWAKRWVDEERASVEERQASRQNRLPSDDGRTHCLDAKYDALLLSFLNGLLLLSVAIDESKIVSEDDAVKEVDKTSNNLCITCDGETSCHYSFVRKPVKSKAVEAMARDGVDISSFFPKSIGEITPQILTLLESAPKHEHHTETKHLRVENDFQQNASETPISNFNCNAANPQYKHDDNHNKSKGQSPMVDNLIVLCSVCSTLKRPLIDISKQTLEWDIDAPTELAHAGEGDSAYLRVSRQIKCKVNEFLNQLKMDVINKRL